MKNTVCIRIRNLATVSSLTHSFQFQSYHLLFHACALGARGITYTDADQSLLNFNCNGIQKSVFSNMGEAAVTLSSAIMGNLHETS